MIRAYDLRDWFDFEVKFQDATSLTLGGQGNNEKVVATV
jgi:hypothetical protein